MNQILYSFVYLIAKLPFTILYFISDIFYIIGYKLIGYRSNVVKNNLKNSFPEKSEKELKQIEKKFFKNFYDFLIETLKGFAINQKQAKERIVFENIDILKKAYEQKKNVILLAGHNFNWEMANVAFDTFPQENYLAIYRKLNNDFWDKKVVESRGKFGAHLIPANQVMKHIKETENNGNYIYAFLADQSPFKTVIKFGVRFLNQKTPVFTGYNRIENKDELLYVYAEMLKPKRGHYHLIFKEILPEGDKFEEYELVVKFNKLLEKTIIEHPENWLWTHKRWKYKDFLTDEMMYYGKDFQI